MLLNFTSGEIRYKVCEQNAVKHLRVSWKSVPRKAVFFLRSVNYIYQTVRCFGIIIIMIIIIKFFLYDTAYTTAIPNSSLFPNFSILIQNFMKISYDFRCQKANSPPPMAMLTNAFLQNFCFLHVQNLQSFCELYIYAIGKFLPLTGQWCPEGE